MNPPIALGSPPHWRRFLPLALFALLLVLLGIGLTLKPREVPSPLIGKPAPAFSLPRLDDAGQRLGTADLLGQVWVINVWASWCRPCREEHPALMEAARGSQVHLIGLNYKDDVRNAQEFLRQLGDPFKTSVVDADGRASIDWGVYGVPETFVVDRAGLIRYKHIGPLTTEVWTREVLPLVGRLQ